MQGKLIHLEVHEGEHITIIGTWSLPGPLIDNYRQQESIGWTIFLSFLRGADKVVVRPKPERVEVDNRWESKAVEPSIELRNALLSRCRDHLLTCPDASELVKEIEEVLK